MVTRPEMHIKCEEENLFLLDYKGLWPATSVGSQKVQKNEAKYLHFFYFKVWQVPRITHVLLLLSSECVIIY